MFNVLEKLLLQKFISYICKHKNLLRSVTAVRGSYSRLIFINRPDQNNLRYTGKFVWAKEEIITRQVVNRFSSMKMKLAINRGTENFRVR
jgi:hypothetical protein